jgi:hypothetical protein
MNNQSEILKAYQRAVNILDDYFEYRYLMATQGENREYVIKTLDDLTVELEKINNENKQDNNK